ncbi:hypothetical protein [Virgibacillus oceani]|uniref:Uncharacterized protein n=1 Tax=Virgibacillus oceani TaxID=1479511 RepID=A0A917GY41_9BACI|nr:hypothetical protein [Virgibacillus oceani]GGG61048.1 hypothetical protein GCM10011398_00370 [Virgibacillus oceani]
MNVALYNQLIEQYSFITEPLWELYGSYNGYSGLPLIGTILLGLIVSTYPSQITYHLGSITYIANQMAHKSNWWIIVISFFIGKVAGVYLIVSLHFWVEKDWVEKFFEGIRNLSGPLYFLLGILLLLSMVRNNGKTNHLSFYKGLLISFCLSLIIDPVALSILNMFIPWISSQNLFLGVVIPFVYVLAAFIPIWIFCILGYGFNLDIFLKKHSIKKHIYIFFGFALIVLAFNQFFLYWM